MKYLLVTSDITSRSTRGHCTARPGDGRADTPTLDISRLDTRPGLDTRGCLGAVRRGTARCVVLDDILIPCLSTTTTTTAI